MPDVRDWFPPSPRDKRSSKGEFSLLEFTFLSLTMLTPFNSLAPGRGGSNFKKVISELMMLQTEFLSTCCESALW